MKIIYSDKYLGYKFGPGHPFLTKRREEFIDLLKSEGNFEIVKPHKASEADILLVHTKDYLNRLKRMVESGGGYLSADTPVNKDNLNAAFYYVGGTVKAANIAIKEGLAVNTLGGLHHAESNNATGFCIFNDHAIAIRKLQKEGKIKKAAVLDLDVHAGNGTQEIFYADPFTLTVSIHQNPYDFYPGTGFAWQEGVGEGRGFNINYPLQQGIGENEYLKVLEKALLKIEEFKSDIMFVVFGVDTYKNDQLGGFKLEKETFGKIAFHLASFSRHKTNEVPMVILFAGGYSIEVPKLWLEIVNSLE